MHANPKGSDWLCEVVVEHRGGRTEHTVSVTAASLARWGRGGSERQDVEDLVRRSFEFLIEREPPTSILGRFDLGVIQTYFPEYDETFRGSRG